MPHAAPATELGRPYTPDVTTAEDEESRRARHLEGLHVLARLAVRIAPLCQREDLTLSQYRHLFLIAQEPVRAAKLADALEVSRPMVAMSIRAMEERGLVQRERVPDDGRGVQIRITRTGRATLRRIERTLLDDLFRLAPKDVVEQVLEALLAFRPGIDAELADITSDRPSGPPWWTDATAPDF